jgi:hypothetical protein
MPLKFVYSFDAKTGLKKIEHLPWSLVDATRGPKMPQK